MSASPATETPVPLLDLKAQFESIESEFRAAVERILPTQYFIMGPEVEAFEHEIARHLGISHAIGCASGSDALLLALMALDLEPGDEVITTPYTFFATVSAITRNQLKPVFVDIDPVTYNMNTAQIEGKITDRTRVLLPVHLFGQIADMASVMKLAGRRNLTVIEDNAQAIGARHGKYRAGLDGAIGCYSFFPSKNLGAAGDGGLMTTADPFLADKLRSLRLHGSYERYFHKWVGINSRLDALQAAILRAKLPHLDRWNKARLANAQRYAEMFEEYGVAQDGHTPERDTIIPPAVVTDCHVFHQYVARVHASRRDGLVKHLQEQKIGCAIYYPLPLHLQECFADLGYTEGDLPESERASRETIALPIYPELSETQQRRVVVAIADYLKGK